MLVQTSILGLWLATQAYSYTPCPRLGPVFEPPNLANEPAVQEAFANLRASLENATSTGETDYGTWSPTNNSFSVGVFDATTPGQLFAYQYSSEALQNAKQGVTNVTEDTIYRVGSLSKLITAYLFLVEVGPKYWIRPVTDFVPRLKQAAEACCADEDSVDCIDWEAVTLGSLASHMSGIPRDYSTIAEYLSPFSVGPEVAVSVGLPPLPASATPPCGLSTTGCSEKAYLNGLIAEHPAFGPFTTPFYSNAGYAVLAIALENITGRSMDDMLEKDLFEKLNMTGSSYRKAKSVDKGAIPPVAELYFTADVGADDPAGSMFSTLADLARMGQGILSSELLSPAVTRQWMKPVSFASAANQAVGMPWEIFRVTDMTDHVFDLYTKAGDLVTYSSYFVLSPDYNVGIAVLIAGNETTSTAEQLADTLTAGVFPAVAKAARQQANAKYAGTYASANGTLNSTLTVSTEPGKPGLVVSNWITNGTNVDVFLGGLLGVSSGIDIRLYPTGLVQKLPSGREQVGYKAVFDITGRQADGGVFDPVCTSWDTGSGTYGNISLDEFVFEIEGGEVVSIEPRAFRVVLKKGE